MATIKELEDINPRTADDLCKIAEILGYRRRTGGQLTCRNGAQVTSLIDFLNDNPGLIEAMMNWTFDNVLLDDDDDEELELDGEDIAYRRSLLEEGGL